jgi:SAM-dependent methyltransferase
VAISTDLDQALLGRVLRHANAQGQLTLAAVPALLEDYVRLLLDTFRASGVEFNEEEIAQLRGIVRDQIEEAFSASSRSDITVAYSIPTNAQANIVEYRVTPVYRSIAETYDAWVSERTPPLFGSYPDTRIWHLAHEHDVPGDAPILDIGAGTGRNALALARRGHTVDAVEMTHEFAEALRRDIALEQLPVRVIQRDVFDSEADLRDEYSMIFLSEVVSDFRSVDQLRAVFELASRRLVPGGTLVFNAFLPKDGCEISDAARQFGQRAYSTIFTHAELHDAVGQLPIELVSDESVFDFEKENLPEEEWPPTSWYEGWTTGRDVFSVPDRESSPIDMRWLVYRYAPRSS